MNTCAGALRPLTAALTLALASMTCLDTAAAQTAPTGFQVLELDYAPASATPGLDLRPGRYLLQLRGTGAGGYEGLLRGPRNEVVAERIAFSASTGCGAGVPAAAVITTRALPAQRGLNVLRLEIGDGAGGCTLSGELPNLGFSIPEKPPQELECDPPVEIQQVGSSDPGPTCNIVEWEPPFSAHLPDVKPGPVIHLENKAVRWTEVARLAARDAFAYQTGRCLFHYAYDVSNAGRTAASATESSLLLERRAGLQLDTQQLNGLSPGASQRVQGVLALPPGTWRVFAHVDSSARVVEKNGVNNARSVIVEVLGNCYAPATN